MEHKSGHSKSEQQKQHLTAREARLKAALKANMAKRKAQSRARKAQSADSKE